MLDTKDDNAKVHCEIPDDIKATSLPTWNGYSLTMAICIRKKFPSLEIKYPLSGIQHPLLQPIHFFEIVILQILMQPLNDGIYLFQLGIIHIIDHCIFLEGDS